MKTKNYPSYIEIDLKQFKKNISIIKEAIGNRLYCLPVKADAYGHGLLQMSKTAVHNGVDYLGVAAISEGIELRQANINCPILVFGAIHEDQIKDLIEYDLEFSLSSNLKAKQVIEYCNKYKKSCKVHIEVDTGMRRTGVRVNTAIDLVRNIQKEKLVNMVGIYSHFAASNKVDSTLTKIQIKEFNLLLDKLKLKSNVITHLANSGGVCFYPESYKDMVRPGAMSFGAYLTPFPKHVEGIKSCFSVKSRVSFFKVVDKGHGISYDHTFVTKNRTRIITVPVGYADGFRRSLSNKAQVIIRNKRYDVVGNICMDQFMVDVKNDDIFIDDEIVIIGSQKNEQITINELAKLCDTTTYEIVCSFNPKRLPRVYIE